MDADASTLKMALMHEAEKQGGVHHFLSLFVRTPPLLASPSPLRLISPSGHANTARNFLTCWRQLMLKNKNAG